jgi:nitrite reductase/ring-hydroxylating ferredoxin subunit
MPAFVGVAWLEQLPAGRAMTVTIGDLQVALANVGGTVHAIDDACLHAGSSLGAGVLEGKVLTCRGHGWRYDVTTGAVLGVRAYPVQVVDGRIKVAVD